MCAHFDLKSREKTFPCRKKTRHWILTNYLHRQGFSPVPWEILYPESCSFFLSLMIESNIIGSWRKTAPFSLLIAWYPGEKIKVVEECNRAQKRDSSRFQVILSKSYISEQAKSAHAMLAFRAKPHWMLIFTIYARIARIRFLCQHVNTRPWNNRDEAVTRMKGPYKHAHGRVSVCCLWLADGAGHSWHKNTCVNWRKRNANLQCEALKVVRRGVNAG